MAERISEEYTTPKCVYYNDLQPSTDVAVYDELELVDQLDETPDTAQPEQPTSRESDYDALIDRRVKVSVRRSMIVGFGVLLIIIITTISLNGVYITGLTGDVRRELDQYKEKEISIQQDVTSLKGSFDDIKKQLEKQISDDFESFVNRSRTLGVVFWASRVTNVSPGRLEKLVFGDTNRNTNDVYDNSTGLFTVPIEGFYWLYSRLCRHPNKTLNFVFRKYSTGLVVMGITRVFPTNTIDCGVCSTIVRLHSGEAVYVSTYPNTTFGDVIFQPYQAEWIYDNAFIGALVNR